MSNLKCLTSKAKPLKWARSSWVRPPGCVLLGGHPVVPWSVAITTVMRGGSFLNTKLTPRENRLP